MTEMVPFMVEAEAARLMEMGEEFFEEKIFEVGDHAVLRRIGFVRTMVAAATYAEARPKAVAHFRERGATEGFELEGIFGAKEIVLTAGSGSMFVFIGEL